MYLKTLIFNVPSSSNFNVYGSHSKLQLARRWIGYEYYIVYRSMKVDPVCYPQLRSLGIGEVGFPPLEPLKYFQPQE